MVDWLTFAALRRSCTTAIYCYHSPVPFSCSLCYGGAPYYFAVTFILFPPAHCRALRFGTLPSLLTHSIPTMHYYRFGCVFAWERFPVSFLFSRTRHGPAPSAGLPAARTCTRRCRSPYHHEKGAFGDTAMSRLQHIYSQRTPRACGMFLLPTAMTIRINSSTTYLYPPTNICTFLFHLRISLSLFGCARMRKRARTAALYRWISPP